MTDCPRKIIMESITRMLARREHAYHELLRKLSQKGFALADCVPVVDEYKSAGIQSDARYAEMRVRSGINKGHGPARLKADCQQWDIDERYVTQAFEECQADWFELAVVVRHKRFGTGAARDSKDKSKQIRFLQYRGFYSEHIQYALSVVEE
ncbi:regulatory protein RecX [Alteromonas gilva]|uniref:Regulatory protein RecX n=1 Tax=Alteromonas gilva TaxID=2987522 RepID=A0ABT5L424_9ALTE|nr:regulatory protein RecX [Alteromonas gilva]MDC8830528.1 regulatory protein RecX [Alteromonas gilva]